MGPFLSRFAGEDRSTASIRGLTVWQWGVMASLFPTSTIKGKQCNFARLGCMGDSMDGFGWLTAFVAIVLAIIALNKISGLDTKIAQLKLQLGQLADELSQLPQGKAKAQKIIEPVPAPVVTAAPKRVWEPKKTGPLEKIPEPVVKAGTPDPLIGLQRLIDKVSKPESATEPFAKPPELPSEPLIKKPETPKRDMEQALASRWFVWIGGVAIAIGGLLFVKYAYDNGLISPTLQIFLGLLMAAGLILAGDRLRRRTVESDYVPAALSAAGLATAFASIYAAYALYELVGPTTDFIGLAVVGLGGLALSLRQGPLIAALGILGSYVTPMMISSPDPSGWSFFPYLLVIMGASFAVLHKRPWWWLGYASIVGSALWSFLWIGGPFEAADMLPLGLFALSIGAISIFAISGRAILASETGSLLNPMGMTEPLKIGSVGVVAASLVLATLVLKSDHAAAALILFFIGMACIAAISWFKQGDTAAAPAAAVLSLIVLMGWQQAAFTEWAMDERGLWSSVLRGEAPQFLRWTLATGAAFTALGLAGVFKKVPPLTWAALAAGSALLFLIVAWGRVDGLLSDNIWALIGVFAAAVLLAVVWLRRELISGANDNLAAGILSVGGATLLLFAEDRMLDGVWLTIGMAVLAAAYAFSTRILAVKLLGPIAAALGSLTTLRLFVSRELWNDDRTLPLGEHWPLYGYGIPVILFYFGARWLRSSGQEKSAMSLEGLSLGLAISLASLEIRVLIGGGITADSPQLLEMSAHILTWLGAAYGLLYRQRIYSSIIASWGARVLIAVSVVAIIGGSMLALNPVLDGSVLQGGAVFNTLLLAYLASAGLLWLTARSLLLINMDKFRPQVEGLAVVLVTTFVSLEIKRLYNGPLLTLDPTDEVEQALLIIAWLGLACGLVYRSNILTPIASLWSGRGLAALSVAAIVLGSLFAFNPVVSGEPLHGNVLLNALLLAYVAPIILLGLIARKLEVLDWLKLRPAVGGLALVLALTYITLETKRVFQGPSMVAWSLSIAESYAYSAVWLLAALALFVAGIKLARQYIRYAGLAVIVLVVLKVFLWDMSSLEGLYRIASFIGLGLCLVGIGWLYQHFVQKPKEMEA